MTGRVTISTITANRRRFFAHTVMNVRALLAGNYELEWVIVEDGDESVEDLVADVPFARYFRLDGRNGVALKRNVANEASRGEYILYLDDDNYAFPHRLLASVGALAESPFLMAGSSDMLIFDRARWSIFQVGPFSQMHATLGTWCIRRQLLEHTRFRDSDTRGEEVAFTRDWSIPILQLGALNTSISFSHGNNTVPKHDLRASWMPDWCPETFITCADSLEFYRSVT